MGYQNFFATRLYTDIGAADTTITLESAPTATSGRLALEARNSTKRELISYTGVSGNDITGVTRGIGGTSATTHTQNSLVEMNLTAEDLEDALNVPNDIETRFDEVIADHVASGLVWTDDTGLTADMSAGVAYINGIRLPVVAELNHAFSASKDTYVDLADNGVLDYNEVANGATPPALAADNIRLALVVTNATDTTAIYQTGRDTLGNYIYLRSPNPMEMAQDQIPELVFDHVTSGGVWSGDSYATTRNASMTAAILYINGVRVSIGVVTARSFTASKDTYVDVGIDGVIDYTEVANNAASPALSANHIRIAIIVTDATDIQSAGSVNQGQEDKLVPVASNNYYAVTDSLGNLICPRDPNRRILGLRRMRASFTVSSATPSLVTTASGTLSVPVIVPDGRKVKVSVYADSVKYATATGSAYVTIHPTSVGTGRIQAASVTSATANASVPVHSSVVTTPTSTSMTYVAGLSGDSGAVVSSLIGGSTSPALILVELI